MKRIYSNIIVFGVIAIVVSMGIVSFYMQKQTNDKVTPLIIEQLVLPYTQAIKSGNYEYAYNELTSPEFKEYYSLDEFIKKQELNKASYGELEDIRSVSGLFLKEKDMHGPWTFKGTMLYCSAKDTQRIILEVINKDNKFKLFKTYRSFVSIRTKKDEIF